MLPNEGPVPRPGQWHTYHMSTVEHLELRSELRNGGVLTPAALAALQQALGSIGIDQSPPLSSSVLVHPSTCTDTAQHACASEAGSSTSHVGDDDGPRQDAKHGWVATVLTARHLHGSNKWSMPPTRPTGLLAAMVQLARARRHQWQTSLAPATCSHKVGKCGADCQGVGTLCARMGGVTDLGTTLQGERPSLEASCPSQAGCKLEPHFKLQDNSHAMDRGHDGSGCNNALTNQSSTDGYPCSGSSVQQRRKSHTGRLFRQVDAAIPLRRVAAASESTSSPEASPLIRSAHCTQEASSSEGSMHAAASFGGMQPQVVTVVPLHRNQSRHAAEQACITLHDQSFTQAPDKGERHTAPPGRTAQAEAPVDALPALQMALSTPAALVADTAAQQWQGKPDAHAAAEHALNLQRVGECSTAAMIPQTPPAMQSPVQHGHHDGSMLPAGAHHTPDDGVKRSLGWGRRPRAPPKLGCICGPGAREFDDVGSIAQVKPAGAWYRPLAWHNKVVPAPQTMQACHMHGAPSEGNSNLIEQQHTDNAGALPYICQFPDTQLGLQVASRCLTASADGHDMDALHRMPWWKRLLAREESGSVARKTDPAGQLLSDATTQLFDAGLAGFTNAANQLMLWPHPQHVSIHTG